MESLPNPRVKRLKMESSRNVFNLNYNCMLKINIYGWSIHVDVREYYYKNGELLPTKRGIVMLPPTYACFREKLGAFDGLYKDNDALLNSQLAVFNKHHKVHLQQIFEKGEDFEMRMPGITLHIDQLETLAQKSSEIGECIQDTLLRKTLWYAVAEDKTFCEKAVHDVYEHAREHVLATVYEELCIKFKETFQCTGCSVNDNSQEDHRCITALPSTKYWEVGEKTIFYINVRSVAEKLLLKFCCCQYNSEFFESISLEDYKAYFCKTSDIKNDEYRNFCEY